MGLHRSCLAATPTESQDFVFQTLHRRSTPSRRALSGTWPKPSTIEDFCFRQSACAPCFRRFTSVCDLLALFTGDNLTIRHGRKKNKKRIAKFPTIRGDNLQTVFGFKRALKREAPKTMMGSYQSCLAATPTGPQNFVFPALHRRSSLFRPVLSGAWPKPSTIEDFLLSAIGLRSSLWAVCLRL